MVKNIVQNYIAEVFLQALLGSPSVKNVGRRGFSWYVKVNAEFYTEIIWDQNFQPTAKASILFL
jgi:hypothetical protein